MFFKIVFLAECYSALVASEWSLICMTHHVRKKFTHTANDHITSPYTIFILIAALKNMVLLLLIIKLFNEIEYKVSTRWHISLVT